MIVFEIIKQLVLTFYVGKGKYQWFYFPFQLCSIPMYVCFIAGLTKKEKVLDACTAFLSTFGLLGGICAFLDTSGFHYTVGLLTVYSYVWHVVLIFIGVFSSLLRKNKCFFPGLGIFFVCSIVAELLNILVTLLTGEEINMFYINLLVPTYQVVVKDVAAVIGDIPAIILYWLSCIFGAFILNTAGRLIKTN